jgi:hypothetical protein
VDRGLSGFLLLCLLCGPLSCNRGGSSAVDDQPHAGGDVWTSGEELAGLPTSGAAWESLLAKADEPSTPPDLSDRDDPENVRTLAKALVFARTSIERYRTQVIASCMAAIGTERDGEVLSLGRELAAYVIAADLVGLPPDEDRRFSTWLRGVTRERLQGMTLVSAHETRPNNWGTHAGASRAAVAAFLGDAAELERCATVFRGYLGDRSAYARFSYGDDLSWQADPARPVGVNPLGAQIAGHSVDGVLPDDQRRAGGFTWPPPKVNYAYEALQGALVQAAILHRAGYPVWEWQDRALLRAYAWLQTEADYPPQGDDTWQPHLVNHYYGTSFPAPVPSSPGKNLGWTDWTHGPTS